MNISDLLMRWYSHNHRNLPWRHTRDPYLIWLSEIILQQTRVDQGLPYYTKFTHAYPNIKQLAAAPDDEVMKLWQGLGYYNRAKNMLKTARLIAEEYEGKFPQTYDKLLNLKGIGPYTAAAIASFAFNEPKAVVDGNVYRVLSRIFAIEEPINSPSGKRIFAEIANTILNKQYPALHNQAIMEFGAMVCKPALPSCHLCVVRENCQAFTQKSFTKLPVKLKKQPIKERFLNFIFINKDASTYVKQRKTEAIWHNLYEPPCIETQKQCSEKILKTSLQQLTPSNIYTLKKVFSTKHQLTHQRIYANFWLMTVGDDFSLLDSSYINISFDELKKIPIHRLFDKFLQFYTLQYQINV
jgi:A/G-specific adenine glycosylase